MVEEIRRYWQLALRFLEARSQQERQKRVAHGVALLLVLAVATVKYFTGVTAIHTPFALCLLAVAAAAAYGGFAPALVATLASVLVAGRQVDPLPATSVLVLFTAEAMLVAVLVTALRSALHARASRLAAAEATNAQLRRHDHHGQLLHSALTHLEQSAGETAVVVLNDHGVITEWREGAERLYGFTDEEALGTSMASLFFASLSPSEAWALLHRAKEDGVFRRAASHRRKDGGSVDVEFELKPFSNEYSRGFTLTVHDLARRQAWDEYRQDAARAQEALQEAVDHARQQLAALENLTDPSLNPLGGIEVVTELLERLRVSVRADGVALVQPGAKGAAVLAENGLRAAPATVRPETLLLSPGRVAVVHNDRSRVEQLSALRWSAPAASLFIVPVVYNGQVWSTIEVVSEQSRQVSDWDVALARVVADRLAAVVVQDRGVAARAS